MSHHIFGFEWLRNPVRPTKNVIPITPEREVELDRAIARLPDILGKKENWVLSGGLVIAQVNDSYYRDHFDIDIGLNERDLEEVVENAAQSDYVLVTRRFMSKIPMVTDQKVDAYEKITPEIAIEEKRKNLRLVRTYLTTGEIREHEGIMDYFDIYTHKIEGSDMVSNEGNIIAPSNYNFGGIHYTLGGPIRLRSLKYIQIIKNKTKSPKNTLDLKVIAELLETKSPC